MKNTILKLMKTLFLVKLNLVFSFTPLLTKTTRYIYKSPFYTMPPSLFKPFANLSIELKRFCSLRIAYA